MKEDVLEQVVEDYLQSRGYFTRHNLKFKPSSSHPDFVKIDDAVHSDIDVIGVHPTKSGVDRVWVVSCKSWQSGFWPDRKLKELNEEVKNPKRPFWKHVREIWSPKWNEAFRDEVERVCGQRNFKYSIAVSKLTGKLDVKASTELWANDPTIGERLSGCEFSFITFDQMWNELIAGIGTTPANSEIGRVAQLLKASGLIT